MNYIIIAAGGSGTRMKHTDNKIFLRIDDKKIIYWTLMSFEKSSIIDGVIISARTSDREKIKDIISENNIRKVIGIVDAGETRQETVLNALNWLKTKVKGNDLIGIHNAANPLVLRKEINDVFRAARKHRAALLANPARDTVKITDKNGMVIETPVRKNCWHAQTPQVGFFGDLIKAFEIAKANNFTGTDDAQLLEAIGIKPKIILSSKYNFKITFPEDLILIKELLPDFIKENENV